MYATLLVIAMVVIYVFVVVAMDKKNVHVIVLSQHSAEVLSSLWPKGRDRATVREWPLLQVQARWRCRSLHI